MDLLDLLDRRDHPATGLRWGDRHRSWAEVWAEATRVQAFVQAHGGSAATVLVNGPAAPAVLLGSLLAGGVTASLPIPNRQEPLDAYATRLYDICEKAGCGLLLLPDEFAALLTGTSAVTVAPYAAAATWTRTPARDCGSSTFVQFTSGTTAGPRGVVLTTEQLGTNVAATLEAVFDGADRAEVEAGGDTCSWLPLSHDMGLVGMLLVPWASKLATVTLRDPVEFLTDPFVWLDDLSDRGAQITATATFGLELVLRKLARKPARDWDLSKVRTLIIGAEPISVHILQQFATALGPYGLDETALSPAYGMAETCLAVSLTKSLEPWRAAVPTDEGGWRLVDGPSCTTPGARVSCGPLVRGYEVFDANDHILVDGPAVSVGYLAESPRTGPHDTGDEGRMVDGELVVFGRADDVVVVRGRKIQPSDVEAAVVDLCRPGTAAAVNDIDGTFTIVLEPKTRSRSDRAAAAEVRAAVSKAVGIAPGRIVFLEKGAALRTTSGKVQRRRTRDRLADGSLAALADHRTVKDGGT